MTAPLNAIGVMTAPEQIVCDDGVATAFGLGFTRTVAVTGVPAQLTGVMVNVTVTGAVVVLVKAPLMLPDPLAAMPVTEAVLFLDQL